MKAISGANMVALLVLVGLALAGLAVAVNYLDSSRRKKREDSGVSGTEESLADEEGIPTRVNTGWDPYQVIYGGCPLCKNRMDGKLLFLADPRQYDAGIRDLEEMVDAGKVPDWVDWGGQEELGRNPHVSVELIRCTGCQTGRVVIRSITPNALMGKAEDESQRQSYEVPPDVVQNLLKAGPPEA